MQHQHIVNAVCVKEVCMGQERLEGDFVSLACLFFYLFFLRGGHSSAFSAEKVIRRG